MENTWCILKLSMLFFRSMASSVEGGGANTHLVGGETHSELMSLTCHYLLPLGHNVSKATDREATLVALQINNSRKIAQKRAVYLLLLRKQSAVRYHPISLLWFILSSARQKRTCRCMKCEICFFWHVMTCSSSHNCIILLNPGLDHRCWEVLHR